VIQRGFKGAMHGFGYGVRMMLLTAKVIIHNIGFKYSGLHDTHRVQEKRGIPPSILTS
jgi:hypothetical protein